jgi:hypothetical protein
MRGVAVEEAPHGGSAASAPRWAAARLRGAAVGLPAVAAARRTSALRASPAAPELPLSSRRVSWLPALALPTDFIAAPAASIDCFIAWPARPFAASAVESFIAFAASSVNCLVSAPHHCSGSTGPGDALDAAGAPGAAAARRGAGRSRFFSAAAGAASRSAASSPALPPSSASVAAPWPSAPAAAGLSDSGRRICSESRRSSICTFIVFSVESVMRWTSSAWMVASSMRAFCSSQNCTVRSSPMRFSSSSGSSVGATHWPMLGSAEPAFFTRL